MYEAHTVHCLPFVPLPSLASRECQIPHLHHLHHRSQSPPMQTQTCFLSEPSEPHGPTLHHVPHDAPPLPAHALPKPRVKSPTLILYSAFPHSPTSSQCLSNRPDPAAHSERASSCGHVRLPAPRLLGPVRKARGRSLPAPIAPDVHLSARAAAVGPDKHVAVNAHVQDRARGLYDAYCQRHHPIGALPAAISAPRPPAFADSLITHASRGRPTPQS